MIWMLIGLYVAGFVATHEVAKRKWYREFGVEFAGWVWALLPALIWPLVAGAYGLYSVDRRRA